MFKHVSLDGIEYVFERFGEVHFPAETVILQRAQENRSLYLLLEGEVRVHLDEHAPPIRILGRGECFGEMSTIDDGQTSAQVVATADCHCLVIDETSLWEMVHRSHGVARNLLLILSRRLKSSNDSFARYFEVLQRWQHFALSDALTGINNRRWLEEYIDRIVGRAIRDRKPLSVIMLDMDHFKAYNDQWGHLGGDQALRTLAQVVRNHLRMEDFVARYGGEEFLMLLPDTGIDAAHNIAERMRIAIAHTPCGRIGQNELPSVTASMGISLLRDHESAAALLDRADRALYMAKQGGRNTVVAL